jgi:hypothetical protein
MTNLTGPVFVEGLITRIKFFAWWEDKGKNHARKLTDLVGQAAEDGASVAAGEPEEERDIGGVAGLGLDEVVEQLGAVVLVHFHVPVATDSVSVITVGKQKEWIIPRNSTVTQVNYCNHWYKRKRAGWCSPGFEVEREAAVVAREAGHHLPGAGGGEG